SKKVTFLSHISKRAARSFLPLTSPREQQGYFSLTHLQESNKVTFLSHISKRRARSLIPPTSPR
ncbi:hypothetical protein ACJMK2_017573, partial [Sinanodonta woodiana]